MPRLLYKTGWGCGAVRDIRKGWMGSRGGYRVKVRRIVSPEVLARALLSRSVRCDMRCLEPSHAPPIAHHYRLRHRHRHRFPDRLRCRIHRRRSVNGILTPTIHVELRPLLEAAAVAASRGLPLSRRRTQRSFSASMYRPFAHIPNGLIRICRSRR